MCAENFEKKLWRLHMKQSKNDGFCGTKEKLRNTTYWDVVSIDNPPGCMSSLKNSGPNSQFFRPEVLPNPPKQLMWLGASRRHLQRRPPDRGYEPLHLAAEGGHLEVVVALLAAGASVDAKDDKGCGPQRRDRCDRTDVVGRRCHGFQEEIRWCSPP